MSSGSWFDVMVSGSGIGIGVGAISRGTGEDDRAITLRDEPASTKAAVAPKDSGCVGPGSEVLVWGLSRCLDFFLNHSLTDDIAAKWTILEARTCENRW
jgi:hypothetical protein